MVIPVMAATLATAAVATTSPAADVRITRLRRRRQRRGRAGVVVARPSKVWPKVGVARLRRKLLGVQTFDLAVLKSRVARPRTLHTPIRYAFYSFFSN